MEDVRKCICCFTIIWVRLRSCHQNLATIIWLRLQRRLRLVLGKWVHEQPGADFSEVEGEVRSEANLCEAT